MPRTASLARLALSLLLLGCTAEKDVVARLAPQRVLLMPGGEVGYWSDDLLDLVALA